MKPQFSEPPKILETSSFNDLLATLPYLKEKLPTPGLVIITIHDGFIDFMNFCDLNHGDIEDPHTVAQMGVSQAVEESCDNLLILGYGTEEEVTVYVREVISVADKRGLNVWNALRIYEGRYWLYLEYCPPEGIRIYPDRSIGPAAAVFYNLHLEPRLPSGSGS